MFAYQKFAVADTDHFIPAKFPQLEASIQKVIEQLASEPPMKTEMLISFVKNHCINSQQVKEFPGLAALISSQSMPLQVMEDLFEASKKNLVFTMQLEGYIKKCLTPNSKKI